MANKIGRLHADLSANSASFERDMKKARNATQKAASGMRRSMATAGKAFDRVAKSLISFRSAAVLAAGAVGLGLLVRKAISTADEIAKTADKIGFATKALQELRFAAGRAGIGQGELDKSLEQFTRRIGEAAGGTGEALQSYKDLGIQLRDTNGKIKDSSFLLGEVADALAAIESPAERANAAYDLFGRQGVGIANLLFKDGKKGLDEYAAAAKRLGIVIEEDILRKAEVANDQIEDMAKVFAKTGTVLALELMPVLQDLAKLLTDPGFIRGIQTAIQNFRDFTGVVGELTRAWRFWLGIATEATDIQQRLHANDAERLVLLEAIERLQNDRIRTSAMGINVDEKVAELQERLNELSREKTDLIDKQITAEERLTAIKAKDPIVREFRSSTIAGDKAEDKAFDAAQRRAQRLADLQLKIARGIKATHKEEQDLRDAEFDAAQDHARRLGDLREKIARGVAETEAESARAFERIFGGIDRALEETVTGVLQGTQTMSDAWRNLASNIIFEIQRIIIQMTLLDPLRNAIRGGGLGGLLSSAVGFVGGLFGATAPTASVQPFSALTPEFAHGGLVTRPTFALIGEAGPEAVIPLSQLKEGGGDVTINVFNNSSARVQTSESRGVDGRKIISLLIEDEVKRNILSGGGVANAITQVFGANRQGAIR